MLENLRSAAIIYAIVRGDVVQVFCVWRAHGPWCKVCKERMFMFNAFEMPLTRSIFICEPIGCQLPESEWEKFGFFSFCFEQSEMGAIQVEINQLLVIRLHAGENRAMWLGGRQCARGGERARESKRAELVHFIFQMNDARNVWMDGVAAHTARAHVLLLIVRLVVGCGAEAFRFPRKKWTIQSGLLIAAAVCVNEVSQSRFLFSQIFRFEMNKGNCAQASARKLSLLLFYCRPNHLPNLE